MTAETDTAIAPVPPQDSRAIAARAQRPQLAPINAEHEVVIVAKRVEGLPPDRQEVERIEHVVTLPAAYQFPMGSRKVKREKRGGDWVDARDPVTNEILIDDTRKVGITSDGYLFLNKTLGYDLVVSAEVTDRDGILRNNPIHQPTYIAIRGGVVYRSDFGQLMWAEETLEADFWHVYQDARINTYSAKVRKKDGVPLLDDAGFPIFDLSDDDERSAARVLSALKASGLKRLKTNLETRLLKVAIGIKSLPLREPQNIDIRLVTFRDALSPEERLERVQQTSAAIFGGTGMKRRVDAEEVMADAGTDDDDAAFLGREEADRVDRSREERPPVAGAYSPEAEERAREAMRQDPATIPGVQRGTEGLRNVTPPEDAASEEAAREAYEADAAARATGAEDGPVRAWTADELRDLDDAGQGG